MYGLGITKPCTSIIQRPSEGEEDLGVEEETRDTTTRLLDYLCLRWPLDMKARVRGVLLKLQTPGPGEGWEPLYKSVKSSNNT